MQPILYPVPDDLRSVASGLRFPEGPIACDDGSILVVEVRGQTLTRISPTGECEVVAELAGGPNGAAIGPDGAVYVCNNGGLPWTQLADGSWYPIDAATGSMQPDSYTHGWIERIELRTGRVDRLYEAASGRALSAPNDIAFDDEGLMWFTDTGKTNAWSTTLGAVYRADIEGSSIACVAFGLIGPNGIAFTPDGDTLVVADTPTGRVWRWDRHDVVSRATPRQHGGTVLATLPGATALDSLAIDVEGRVVVALPGTGALAVVEPDGVISLIAMPDPMPTNICFGGPDRSTAFVTLGGFGDVVSFRWPCAGAPVGCEGITHKQPETDRTCS
jgi:gluconolactonase